MKLPTIVIEGDSFGDIFHQSVSPLMILLCVIFLFCGILDFNSFMICLCVLTSSTTNALR